MKTQYSTSSYKDVSWMLTKDLDIAERIEITTNASLLKPKISAELIDAQLDYIRCSIYSVDQKRHESVTQNKINIEKIKNNIINLKVNLI